jgi:hypothetical protein
MSASGPTAEERPDQQACFVVMLGARTLTGLADERRFPVIG